MGYRWVLILNLLKRSSQNKICNVSPPSTDRIGKGKNFDELSALMGPGAAHGFSPVGARFPIDIVHCVLERISVGATMPPLP